MVYCTSTYTIQILYSIKMQIVLCYSEHTVTVLNYKSKHWFVTRGSPAVEIIVRRRDWRRGFQSCCSPWCWEERTVSERGRGWESEGRDAASPQAIEGSAGRLSLACLREMLSDYLCQSHLRIITHLQDLLYLQALHYSFQHLQEPHRCLHPELLNTGGWKTWSGKLCPWGNSHRVVFSTVQMSQEHLTRESVDLCHPWLTTLPSMAVFLLELEIALLTQPLVTLLPVFHLSWQNAPSKWGPLIAYNSLSLVLESLVFSFNVFFWFLMSKSMCGCGCSIISSLMKRLGRSACCSDLLSCSHTSEHLQHLATGCPPRHKVTSS